MSPKVELIVRIIGTIVFAGLIFLANAYLLVLLSGASEQAQSPGLGMIVPLILPASIGLTIFILVSGIKSARSDYHYRMKFGDEPVDLDQLAIEIQDQMQQLENIEKEFERQQEIRRSQNKDKNQRIGFSPIFGTFVLRED